MFKWVDKITDWLFDDSSSRGQQALKALILDTKELVQKQKINTYSGPRLSGYIYSTPDSVTMQVESVRKKEHLEARKLVVAEALRNSDDEFDKIRELAYCKWEAAGRPEGESERFWIEAEKELQLDGAWVSMWGL